MIYLDNAATSFPKPAECLRAALEFYLEHGASPGRGGYDLAVEAEETVTRARDRLGRFFGGDEHHHVCFTYNATDALNTLIQGLVAPGCHVVSSRLEHNSVLRPLHHLQRQGLIHMDLVPFDERGFIDPAAVLKAIRPETRFVLLSHASNVLGTVQPVQDIGTVCRERGVPLLLDTAQSAGVVPIRMKEWGVQGLVFTGHKSLLGPTGIGGLVLGPDLHPQPSRYGGTGLDSRSLYHTLEYPQRLEAGTVNLLGILCLDACLIFVEEHRKAHGYEGEMALWRKLRDGMAELGGVKLYCADSEHSHLPLLTCNLEGHSAEDAGAILDGDFGIAVRTGLHCAPLVHEDLGTIDKGAVRFSLGAFTTEGDIVESLRAISMILRKGSY